MSDIDAIIWTLSLHNSTSIDKDSVFPRGGGLKLIEKFLKEYNGKSYIISGNAYYSIGGYNIVKKNLQNPIIGTFDGSEYEITKEKSCMFLVDEENTIIGDLEVRCLLLCLPV